MCLGIPAALNPGVPSSVRVVACAAQGAAYLEDVGTTRQTCQAEPIPEVEAFIDYKLTEMASRNEPHEFEEIATRIARKRISSNILVANGPVSAVGW